MTSMTCHRCNHPDTLALSASDSKWAKGQLSYIQSVAYAGVSPDRIARNYRRALDSISSVCGMTFTLADSLGTADVIAVSSPIDGPWNTLALSELPPTGDFAGKLHQWFDQTEQLDDDTMVAMFAHEFCHILGLGHSFAGTLMAPMLDKRINAPQPDDVAKLQARYGPPAKPPAEAPGAKPDAPPVGPSPGTFTQRIQIGIPGQGLLSYDLTVNISDLAFQPGP